MQAFHVTPVAALGLVLAASGCGSDGECDPMVEACTLSATVSTITVAAGEENEDLCQSWTLNNPTELWVTSIRQSNDGAYHHANWFFVPDDQFDLPDGMWKCSDHEFSELVAAILGGYLFAMSTQSFDETQQIPSGGAIRIPPYSRIIGASHVLNASDADITSETRIELGTIPPDQVAARLAPGRIEYRDLTIDPNGRSSFSAECILDEVYEETMGAPLQLEIYYALSHYHELGTYAQLELLGGPRDGEVLFRHDGYGENFGVPFDPPLDVAATGARGLRFTCGFDNPRDEVIGWGIGDQEMCVMALQSRTEMGFDAKVGDGRSEQVGTGPDGEVQYRGACSVLGVPWDHQKPGGPER
jgi:hypothetical protein